MRKSSFATLGEKWLSDGVDDLSPFKTVIQHSIARPLLVTLIQILSNIREFEMVIFWFSCHPIESIKNIVMSVGIFPISDSENPEGC